MWTCDTCGIQYDPDEPGVRYEYFHGKDGETYRVCHVCRPFIRNAQWRAIAILREQNGLTLFENGAPMNVQEVIEQEFRPPFQPEVRVRRLSLWESFWHTFWMFRKNVEFFVKYGEIPYP